MKNKTDTHTPRRFSYGHVVLILTVIISLSLFVLLPGYVSNNTSNPTTTPNDAAQTHKTKITRIAESSVPRIHTRKSYRSNIKRTDTSDTSDRATTAITADNNTKTTDTQTPEPLHQEAYIAALMAMMEEDGRDNALIHYALAFEIAPPYPTPEQAALIKLVLKEGWDERAAPLLPYLLAWQDAFKKLHHGAGINYARGIGSKMGPDTPVPNFLSAQTSAKMLAVYSRYLESQGRTAEAVRQFNTMLTMGRDFNSPGNLLVGNLIGTAIESVGVRQLSRMVSDKTLSPSQLKTVADRLQYFEQGQPNMLSVIDGEMTVMLIGVQKNIENPEVYRHRYKTSSIAEPITLEEIVAQMDTLKKEYHKVWVGLSDKFSVPYWEREQGAATGPATDEKSLLAATMPNFAEAEARFLSVTSRLRQQQINIAAQRYMTDFHHTPPGINSLVGKNYLPAVPVDPFTGKSFIYTRTENGYHLYGSGPNISAPNDPNVDWNPSSGTFSPGVIRTR